MAWYNQYPRELDGLELVTHLYSGYIWTTAWFSQPYRSSSCYYPLYYDCLLHEVG